MPAPVDDLILRHRNDILALARKHGVSNIRIFGSHARGEAGPHSDLDLLVQVDAGRTLFDVGGLLMDLQDLLGCKVDIVTERSLHVMIRERVLREAVPL